MMAGKWHIDAAGHEEGTQKALPFGRLVQAYTQGYQSDQIVAPAKTDAPQLSAWEQGQADAAAGLNPGFTAVVAPEPPPPDDEPKHKKKVQHK